MTAFDFTALERMGATVRELSADSRKIRAGVTFAAFPGEHADGRRFIGQAVAAGANAVLWEKNGFDWNAEWKVPNLGIEGLREKIGVIADQVYGRPSEKLWVIGITGTNGKTSCAHWLAQALAACGKKTALVGTLGNGFPGALSPALNTTPDPIVLQASLADYLAEGAECVAMEVSSHGLAQGRVNGTRFAVALFTNLSRDHLDYHGDMASYAAAKSRLFTWPGLKYAVVNLDDPFGVELAGRLGCSGVQVVGYTLENSPVSTPVRVEGRGLEVSAEGIRFEAVTSWGRQEIRSAMLGRFNGANLLGVLAALLVSGVPLARAAAALSAVKPATGRLHRMGGGDQPLVVVDYAHTPDALEKALSALREILPAGKRLSCVFGCGGNRDQGKRPLMGAVAERLADEVVVTSDNPRHEDPAAIIDAIVAGMTLNKHQLVADRAEAIARAVFGAKAGDIVLVAGKGHEDYQEINGTKRPFSDIETVRWALAEKMQIKDRE
ncbi:MAG: UDP-N-acetylmuramoyl-L-alanyl-D-glutamate--2,6-diaminopimelate ligase [Sulfuricellaceae bacterium]|jgi:UDP-N-acetylmuramoyl-L-alanyl-D-glutamate--2,6-diaminopimelate ligase